MPFDTTPLNPNTPTVKPTQPATIKKQTSGFKVPLLKQEKPSEPSPPATVAPQQPNVNDRPSLGVPDFIGSNLNSVDWQQTGLTAVATVAVVGATAFALRKGKLPKKFSWPKMGQWFNRCKPPHNPNSGPHGNGRSNSHTSNQQNARGQTNSNGTNPTGQTGGNGRPNAHGSNNPYAPSKSPAEVGLKHKEEGTLDGEGIKALIKDLRNPPHKSTLPQSGTLTPNETNLVSNWRNKGYSEIEIKHLLLFSRK